MMKKRKNDFFDSSLKNAEYVYAIDKIVMDLFGCDEIGISDLIGAFWGTTKVKGMDKNLYMALVFDRFKAKVKSKYKVKIKIDVDNERVFVNDKSNIEDIRKELV